MPFFGGKIAHFFYSMGGLTVGWACMKMVPLKSASKMAHATMFVQNYFGNCYGLFYSNLQAVENIFDITYLVRYLRIYSSRSPKIFKSLSPNLRASLFDVHSFWFIRNMAKEVEYSDFLNFATVSVLKFLRYFLFSEKFSEYSEKF